MLCFLRIFSNELLCRLLACVPKECWVNVWSRISVSAGNWILISFLHMYKLQQLQTSMYTCHKNETSESILVLDWNTLELKPKTTKQTKQTQTDDANTVFETQKKEGRRKQDFQSTYNFFFFFFRSRLGKLIKRDKQDFKNNEDNFDSYSKVGNTKHVSSFNWKH